MCGHQSRAVGPVSGGFPEPQLESKGKVPARPQPHPSTAGGWKSKSAGLSALASQTQKAWQLSLIKRHVPAWQTGLAACCGPPSTV